MGNEDAFKSHKLYFRNKFQNPKIVEWLEKRLRARRKVNTLVSNWLISRIKGEWTLDFSKPVDDAPGIIFIYRGRFHVPGKTLYPKYRPLPRTLHFEVLALFECFLRQSEFRGTVESLTRKHIAAFNNWCSEKKRDQEFKDYCPPSIGNKKVRMTCLRNAFEFCLKKQIIKELIL